MKIAHTILNEADSSGPKRRFYSPELKTQVVQECRQSGASVARVALSHGINANIVHRWLHEDDRAALLLRAQSFIPLSLDNALSPPRRTADGTATAPQDIRVQVQRGNSAITVSWPLQGADTCAAWLREWLR
jgi:transposase